MIIRSIRNFGKIYDQVANMVSDTEELIRNRSTLDFENDDCEVELVNHFPEKIFLRASLHPVAIDEVTRLTRTDAGKNFVIANIYDSKFFHSNSEVKNHFCKSISILYEGTGYYTKNDQNFDFSDRHFENFELDFDDELFRMDFQTCDEKFLYEQIENLKIILGPNEKYSTVFYPYGGFYFYGCHSKHIEPCLCCAQFEQKDLRIKSYTYSSLLNKNIDVTQENSRNNKIEFIESPHIGLYEKIKNGEVKIKVKNHGETTFKSTAVFNLPNTNLITIKFIKEEK
ncbi:MAG: hypothetical protein J6P84_01425 [Alphaproteobacteria bacterium]|nr:hypothetical protein [Alphaproteobacteria bacterium]MBO7537631.1 hypothetical protein [Alphaproteobacteria bacterium]MBO7641544.1 hypothetical protein [Alphaproteobacteria bacterium]